MEEETTWQFRDHAITQVHRTDNAEKGGYASSKTSDQLRECASSATSPEKTNL